MNKKTIGIVLTLLGLFMLSYGVIVSGAFTANNSDKNNNKEEKKEETLKTLAENIVLYDENNIKIKLNELTRFKYEDTYYFEMDCDFENNTDKQYLFTVDLKVNNISNVVVSSYKLMGANNKQNMKGHSYESYLKEYKIDDFFNAFLEVTIIESNSGETTKKIYKLEDTYVKDDATKNLGELVYSNEKVDVRFLGFQNTNDKKRAVIIVKNKMDKEYNFLVDTSNVIINGNKVYSTYNNEIESNSYGIEGIYFKYDDEIDTIKNFEFKLERMNLNDKNEPEEIVTDTIVIKK